MRERISYFIRQFGGPLSLAFASTLLARDAFCDAPAPPAAVAPTKAGEAARALDPILQSLETQLAAVEAMQKQVFGFAEKHTLTPRGQKAMAETASKLRAAKALLSSTLDGGKSLRASGKATEIDVKKLEDASAAPVASGSDAVRMGFALTADAAAIDGAAELREKKAQEAEAAAAAAAEARALKQAEAAKAERTRREAAEATAAVNRAAAEAAEADRKTKAEAAERDRKAAALASRAAAEAAEAERKTRAEAQERERALAAAAAATARAEAAELARNDEKARIAGAARAQSDARMRAWSEQAEKVQKQAATLTKGLSEDTAHATESAAALTAFLAHDNLTPAAKRDGTALLQRLRRIEARSTSALARAKDAERPQVEPRTALATLDQVKAETADLDRGTHEACLASAALIAAPASVQQGRPAQNVAAPPVAAAPPPPPPPAQVASGGGGGGVPTCEISFEPSEGSKGISLAIDGGRAMPLPAKVSLGSGRHQLSVRRGQAREDRNELFVCGRISVVPIEPPK